MTYIGYVEVRQELDHHKAYEQYSELDYPLLGAFFKIYNFRSYIADYKRNDQRYCRSHNSKEHIQKECSHIGLIIAYELFQIL